MKKDIKDKLRVVFSKKSLEETDVVYILSRIRKILEIDDKLKLKKFRKLKFYCDWALHAKINNTDSVGDELINLHDTLSSYKFFSYESFHLELQDFLKEYIIQTDIYESFKNKLNFNQKLTDIYSDTPLIYKNKKIVVAGRDKLKILKINGIKVYIPAIGFKVINNEN